MRRTAIALTTFTAAVWMPAVAWADPVAPQPDTPCASELSEAMTWPPAEKWPLQCVDNQWQAVTTPQPPNDRWLSFGPPITLHGQGQRNPNVASGNWTAVPQDADSSCRAAQQVVIEPGVVSSPQVTESPKGQPLSVQMAARLFSVVLSGNCLWTRTGG